MLGLPLLCWKLLGRSAIAVLPLVALLILWLASALTFWILMAGLGIAAALFVVLYWDTLRGEEPDLRHLRRRVLDSSAQICPRCAHPMASESDPSLLRCGECGATAYDDDLRCAWGRALWIRSLDSRAS